MVVHLKPETESGLNSGSVKPIAGEDAFNRNPDQMRIPPFMSGFVLRPAAKWVIAAPT